MKYTYIKNEINQANIVAKPMMYKYPILSFFKTTFYRNKRSTHVNYHILVCVTILINIQIPMKNIII